MNRSLLFILIGLIWASDGFARDNSLLARVTVYWAHGGLGSDRDTRQHKSATGTRLRQGHCAVDPKRIAYGSRVVLPDGSALSAVDTGTAVRNRIAARYSGRTTSERNAVVVDKFFETKRQALAWANSNPLFVNINVIPPNAPQLRKPNITGSQRISLNPATATPNAVTSSTSATVASTGPSGGAIKNPLGRLGR